MTVLEIIEVGHPTLRRRSRELAPEELAAARTQRLIDDMIETMRAAGGAGIAANQVGETVRIAVAEVDRQPALSVQAADPADRVRQPRDRAARCRDRADQRGCLSVPNLRGELARHVNVRVRYLDREGGEHDEVKRGLTAGTFQHEVDHLDGVLFLDRVTDPRTLTTWEQFERFGRDEFVERITAFAERVGS